MSHYLYRDNNKKKNENNTQQEWSSGVCVVNTCVRATHEWKKKKNRERHREWRWKRGLAHSTRVAACIYYSVYKIARAFTNSRINSSFLECGVFFSLTLFKCIEMYLRKQTDAKACKTASSRSRGERNI